MLTIFFLFSFGTFDGLKDFGEILEWTGFAIASQSLAAWSFVAFTCANLIPRGVAHHQWYLEHFQDKYPRNRKAIIPFLW
jgi:hypothetical protein